MNARQLALMALVTVQFASSAAADNFSWNFQRTGFRSSFPSTMPQTAVSMRANQSWPVVYGIDQGRLNAYSLFPVPNPGPVPFGPATNWHQIGTDLTKSFLPSSVYLQAASGAPDGFGVAVQAPTLTGQPGDAVIVGNSFSGFQSPQIGMQALKFDADGDPVVANNSTIPLLPPNQSKLFDIALAPSGEMGAVTQFGGGEGPLTFWQRSPLLGNNWLSAPAPDARTQRLLGATVDLTYDSSSRPHILGIDRVTSNNTVAASRFDIMTGAWISSTLDAPVNSPPIADVAAASNDDGIVGAAWVANGVLKYAYLDANEPSPSWVVTTVASATPTGMPLELSQGIGLAYDNAGLPVISFVERGNRQIWIAYDPPIVTPNPPVAGDFNGDGLVDGGDLQVWSAGFGNGMSDGSDFLAWQRNLNGSAASAAGAAIPEPASLSIVLIAAAAFAATSRRRTAQSVRRIQLRF
jgi:hypothetical protein